MVKVIPIQVRDTYRSYYCNAIEIMALMYPNECVDYSRLHSFERFKKQKQVTFVTPKGIKYVRKLS